MADKSKGKTKSSSQFNLLIMDPDRKIYEGTASNIFLKGNTGEFELLAYHYPVLSLLDEGEIVIDWQKSLSIKRGIIKFFKNDCTILVELQKSEKPQGLKQ
jgi:F0F1-type ATP synthase epsilon subunit